MSEWMPIETAPKNARVLVFVKGGVRGPSVVEAYYGVGPDGDYNHPGWNPTYGQASIWTTSATHWMPLPQPPKESEE